MVAGGVLRRAALHPVLPLRAHLRRGHGRGRAGRHQSRRHFARSLPNKGDHLECDECGACIDICPVGALTSGTYRYKTRPWEMEHVGTICTHCSNGCKTTLGVRNGQIIRGNNRDRSGINGEFLCIKGRYAFDFVRAAGAAAIAAEARGRQVRSRSPGPRRWRPFAKKFSEVKARGGKFGVIGSNHTTNEENFYLQKFAREVLGTDEHRSSPHRRRRHAARCAERQDRSAGHGGRSVQRARRCWSWRAISRRSIRCSPFRSAPTTGITGAHLRGDAGSGARGQVRGEERARRRGQRDSRRSKHCATQLKAEPELVILFGDAIKGDAVRKLVAFGDSLGIPVKYVCLVDYSNSRGAVDMGCSDLPGSAGLGLGYDEILVGAGSGRALGGRRESAEGPRAGRAQARSSSCRTCS